MRRRRELLPIEEVAMQQSDIVRAMLTERAELIVTGEAPPLPDGILAMIEGGWVTMERALGDRP